VIRRARDAAPPALPSPAPARPLVDELLLPEGRATLERLVRRHGARRKALVDALSAWRTAAGPPAGEAELARLLEHHGLARAFERRERDELLHALRAARGILGDAAARLGIDGKGLQAALARLGAGAEAERIREDRRAALRRKATLAERARLLLSDEPRLEDLGLRAEVEQDLRRRLPEHARALPDAGASLPLALARSLSLTAAEARALATRFELRGPTSPAPRRDTGEAPRRRRPTPSPSAPASPSRRPPRPRTGRRSASSSSGRSGR
jgi:hypothetical protein